MRWQSGSYSPTESARECAAHYDDLETFAAQRQGAVQRAFLKEDGSR